LERLLLDAIVRPGEEALGQATFIRTAAQGREPLEGAACFDGLQHQCDREFGFVEVPCVLMPPRHASMEHAPSGSAK